MCEYNYLDNNLKLILCSYILIILILFFLLLKIQDKDKNIDDDMEMEEVYIICKI